MISQTGEYALRAVVCLADTEHSAMTAQQIAAIGKVPPGYMAKVLMALSRAGILHSRRGLKGGFTLARPASELTVLEVLDAVDPVQRIRNCPLGVDEHAGKLCALHQRLDAVAAQVEGAFGSQRILDLLDRSTSNRPLCLSTAEADRVEVQERSESITRPHVTRQQSSVADGAGKVGSRNEPR